MLERSLFACFFPSLTTYSPHHSLVKNTPGKGCCKRNRKEVLCLCLATSINLLMGALAEFERDLIRERTNAGLAAARARGRVGGRPRKLKTNGKVALARRMFAEQSHSISEMCAALGISRATLYRYVKEATPPVSDS